MQKLLNRVQTANSLLCVGLDPTGDDATVARRLREVVAETAAYAAAFKPNLAFFLSRENGVALLQQTVQSIPADIPVILDGKFGDIANTAEQYARFAYDIVGADGVTVNPYMGDDTIRPFARPGKVVFSLAKTSNKPIHGLQDAAMTRGGSISDWAARLAKLMDEELTESTVGLVVGASEPETVAKLRASCPEQWFLVPGIGAQGGDLSSTLRAGLRADGSGLLINSSRGIWQAADAGAAARELMEQINQFRTVKNPAHA
ncbi:orotidine-5'-phosphate decarboxylase [Hymenobacter sp. BT683]|uniref:Orotidine-5'-phosphate decarboxylase n=1 Tax=Hymenobacter jeongseonensis TaxID=2791027 RepID=A0ABS0IKQ0_9BACT|nr:orotidine-5'-phosphate decarboxylase [Hymenobacter jeongseonensis]MBF9238609.1 orotidine-5'-phosphate decarboxylase [Hymenobacter jeongseonensis]